MLNAGGRSPEKSDKLSVMSDPKSDDDKRRDEILKRMLNTPHKPHVEKPNPKKKAAKKRKAPKA